VNGINYIIGNDLPLRRFVDKTFEKLGQENHCTSSVTAEMKYFYTHKKNK
jgi:hypothetical protein